jgi:hypothetical protein
MKFIKNLSIIIEGIGSTINLKNFTFNLKDEGFLSLIDELFICKKIILLLNEEILNFNSKSKKIKKGLLEINLNFNDNNDYTSYYKIIEKVLNENSNLDKIKKDFVNEIINNIKNHDEKTVENLISEIKEDLKIEIKSKDFILYHNLKSTGQIIEPFIHDFVFHLLNNLKDLKYFNYGGESYSFLSPYNFSPSSILRELFSLQSAYIADPIEYIDHKLKQNINNIKDNEKDKIILMLNEYFKNNDYEKKIAIKFTDKFIKKINYKIYENELLKFTDNELKILNDFLIKNNLMNDFSEILNDFIKSKRLFPKKHSFDMITGTFFADYNFSGKVYKSIYYKKYNKHPIEYEYEYEEDEEDLIYWKDFRVFFKNYPNVLKLFPKEKYKDDMVFYDSDNHVNDKVRTAILITDLLKKKIVPKKDFLNIQEKIESILYRISLIIKNNIKDNKKYYNVLYKKIN